MNYDIREEMRKLQSTLHAPGFLQGGFNARVPEDQVTLSHLSAVLGRWTIGGNKLVFKTEGKLPRVRHETGTADEAISITKQFIGEVCVPYLRQRR